MINKSYFFLIIVIIISLPIILRYDIIGIHKLNSYMQITSSAFKNQEYIPQEFTCSGANVNPSIFISDYPEKTKSFVLIVEDPDAPSGTWVHWTVWNIPAISLQQNADEKIATVIPQGNLPQGVEQGLTSFGTVGYSGPCPPPGKPHHYIFKVFALDVPTLFNLSASTTATELEEAIEDHVLEKGELVGIFAR